MIEPIELDFGDQRIREVIGKFKHYFVYPFCDEKAYYFDEKVCPERVLLFPDEFFHFNVYYPSSKRKFLGISNILREDIRKRRELDPKLREMNGILVDGTSEWLEEANREEMSYALCRFRTTGHLIFT